MDNLQIAKFRRRVLHGSSQSAVGVSIAVDKIVAAVTDRSDDHMQVCTLGSIFVEIYGDTIKEANKVTFTGFVSPINLVKREEGC